MCLHEGAVWIRDGQRKGRGFHAARTVRAQWGMHGLRRMETRSPQEWGLQLPSGGCLWPGLGGEVRLLGR